MKWELGALKMLSKNSQVPGIALADAVSEIEKLQIKAKSDKIILDSRQAEVNRLAIQNLALLDELEKFRMEQARKPK